MTPPNEKPIRFADGLGACDLCGAPIVSGLLCQDCQLMAEEWAGLAEDCRPDECRHAEDEEGIA